MQQHCAGFGVPKSTFGDRLKNKDPYAVPERGFSGEDKAAIVDALAFLAHLHHGKDTRTSLT
jgi:hypothetical protein